MNQTVNSSFTVQPWQLRQKQQCLCLTAKEIYTERRIRNFYEEMDGQIYVSVSGKDSLVALDITRKLYPEVPGVFVNTGLEFPEIVEFWENTENTIIIRPKKTFNDVIENYGWPIISKKVSMGISRYRNTKDPLQKELRLHGGVNPTSGKKQHRTIPVKYHHLVDAPFKISERCCDVMKKEPLIRFHRETGLFPITGEMAQDSDLRKEQYLKNGCNMFGRSIAKSTPLAIWLEEQIWGYIKKNNIPYPSVYDMGYDRTGCIWCLFGIFMELKKGHNRVTKMKKTHPVLWDILVNKLDGKLVLDVLGVPYDEESESRYIAERSGSQGSFSF